MTKISLVRHGQNEDNVEGILNGHRDRPLTDLGRGQARIVVEKLVDKEISVVYSSPLKRAYESATIIANRLGLTVQVDPQLIERDFGIMTGKLVTSILELPTKQVLRTNRVNYFLEAEDAEDFPTLYLRASKVVARVKHKHPDEHVLLVAHGDIGKIIRAAYHGWGWKQGLMTPYFNNTAILELEPVNDVIE